MSSYEPEVLHFKFPNFANFLSEPNDDEEVIGRSIGAKYQTQKLKLGYIPDEDWMRAILRFTFPTPDFQDKYTARIHVTVRDGLGKVVHESNFLEELDNVSHFPDQYGRYTHRGSYNMKQMFRRSDILGNKEKFLVNGDLNIDVYVQIKHSSSWFYSPTVLHSKNLLAMYETGAKSDISFRVNDGTVFRSHSQILFANAPILAEFSQKQSDDDAVVIEGVSAAVFDVIMRFIYGGEYPSEEEMLSIGRDVIEAANKFELVELKMTVETALVQNRILDRANVVEYLLFADAMTCPLLKEYAISFYLSHARDVLELDSSNELLRSVDLMRELWLANSSLRGESYGSNVSKMSVTELREALAELELNVDGSKEALVSRLEEHRVQLVAMPLYCIEH